MFVLKLLGGASLHGESGPLTGPVAQRRSLAFLALLATSPTGSLSRDKLVAYLWPEGDTKRARHLLADALYTARRELGKEAILAVGEDLRLNPEIVSADVREFEEALTRGDRERAVAVYTGPFLDGFFLTEAPEFERWVEIERERLARSYARAVEDLAVEREARGDFVGSADFWERLAEHDPYNSRIALALMHALDAAGDRAGALRHALVHARRLREDLGVEPDAEFTALAERLRAEPMTTPQPRTGIARVARQEEAPSARGSTIPAQGPAAEEPRPGVEEPEAPPRRRPWGRWTAVLAGATALALAATLAPDSWRDRLLGRPAVPPIRALAVLPFENLSKDDEQEYLADGMTDALITDLARIGRIRVISRTSVMRYKGRRGALREIARELGVDAVVEGTVLRVGNRVRISAQLVHAAADRHLCAESYERELRDVLALQNELARAIALEVDAKTTARELARAVRAGPVDPAAYELYLKGRYAWNRRTEDGMHRAIEFFRQAIEKDPGYALAYAGLADAYNLLAAGWARVTPARLYAEGEAAARRAIELDSTLAEAHASLALGLAWYHYDWRSAEREFKRAIELNPSYATARQWYGLILAGLGKIDAAIAELERGVKLDPLSPAIATDLARVLYYERHYDPAIEQARKTLALDPDFARAHGVLAATYLQKGMVEEAIAEHEKAIALSGGWLPQRWGLSGLGYAYAVSGRRAEALDVLRRLLTEQREQSERAVSLAIVYLGLGAREEALRWLEQAVEERGIYLLHLRDPVFDPIRSDPRFRRVLSRMNVDGERANGPIPRGDYFSGSRGSVRLRPQRAAGGARTIRPTHSPHRFRSEPVRG